MTKEQKSFTVTPTGEMKDKTEPDGTLALSSEKPVSIDMKNILSIGIQNVVDIKSYQQEHLEHSTRHIIEFHGGGKVDLEYSDSKDIIKCSIRGLITEIEQGRIIVIRK